jgi:tetratricopeptide (TPR) repeat protein
MPASGDAAHRDQTRRADLPGQRSAQVQNNPGIVQTGDQAQARQVTTAVSLGSPHSVDPPRGGLVGLVKRPARVFVGRDDQLAELDAIVGAGSGVIAQAVYGLGGVGKTELALQYVRRYRSRYRVVWWVTAETPATVEDGLAELAHRLHPDVQVVATQQEAAAWALAWLQSHDGWLLVLDNVEHRHHVERLLGDLTRGHVLITTRRDVGWDDITDGCLRLDVLTPAAAVTMLTQLAGQDDPATAGVLAGELGCLPLALQQAGAYLRQTRTPIASYLTRLREDPAQALDTTAAGTVTGRADEARRVVARTWSVTITDIANQNPTALLILRILACYAPDDIPRDLLSHAADPDQVDDALGLLASYSMIALTTTTVAVHRLVQTITLAQLHNPDDTPPRASSNTVPDGLADALAAAITCLRESWQAGDPSTDVAKWPHWAVMSPHVAAAADLCPDTVGGQDLNWLLGELGVFEQAQGRYRQALVYRMRALAIGEAVLGPEHPDVAIDLDNLASSLHRLGRAGEAEPLQRRALAITEAAFGPDHPDVAVRVNNLAMSLHDLGRTGEAEPLQRRALAISEAALGPDHPSVAIRLGNLASSLHRLGRAGEAEPLQRRALAITEAALGPDHPAVAIYLNNLAMSLHDLGRVAAAEPLQRRALAISEAALGPDHPSVAIRLGNLASSLHRLGRVAEAEPLQRRALAISEAAFGPDHPAVAIYLNNLAVCLRELGRVGEAQPLQRRALAIRERATEPQQR